MNVKASAYASLLMTVTAVFILITGQLALTSVELRISRLHEIYGGLYEIGVSTAEAGIGRINGSLLNADDDILAYYMENYDWMDQCEPGDDGSFVLTGKAFYLAYQEIARGYIDTPDNSPVRITHGSSVDIEIQPDFKGIGTEFTVTVKNNRGDPLIKNMTRRVEIKGEIKWNPDPPVYTLLPNFDINEETPAGKGFGDFTVIRDSGYTPVILFGVCQK